MPIYQLKPVYHECEQVTVDNLQQLADWCGGRILGIARPVSQQGIELNSNSNFEIATVGDWICKTYGTYFKAHSPYEFDTKYLRVPN